MAWAYNVSLYSGAAAAEIQTLFGQLAFSGNYATGGDGSGTFTFGGNTMKRWQCSCLQFCFRCVARRRHCKHARLVAKLAEMAHGAGKLARAIHSYNSGGAQ